MKPKGSGTYAPATTATQKLPKAQVVDNDEGEPTMVRCPTCAGVIPKLGCQTCIGAGWISYERYLAMTTKCPTCTGSGRVTNDQADALNADARRRENDK